MILKNKTDKFLATFFFIAVTIWLGGSLTRTVIGYSVFEPSATQTLIRKVSNDILMQSVYLYSASSIYTIPAYLIAFATAIYFMFRLKTNLKKEGWILMSVILFFISAPIQLYNIYLDIRLSLEIFWGGNWEFYSSQIQDFFLKRFTSITINSLSSLSFLAVLTILVYFVWQPLKKE